MITRNPARVRLLVTLVPFLFAAVFPFQGAQAQLTYLDEIPWFAPADSTSRLAFLAEINHFEDAKYDWSVNRLHVCGILPAGGSSVFFLRMSHWSFKTGGLLPATRWPWIQGDQEDFQSNSETSISSFGQPEVGATGAASLPGISSFQYGVALGLPVGVDRLYPFSSVSLPFRVALRRAIRLGSGPQLALTGVYLMNMASGKDLLDETAFPGGWDLGAAINWYRGRGSRLGFSFDLKNHGGRISQLLGVQAWVPWTPDGSVGIKVARELGGTLHGPAAWYFGLSWRFDSPGHRPASELEEIK